MTDQTPEASAVAVARFLKERDEALFTGDGFDATDEERVVSAREIIALLHPYPALKVAVEALEKWKAERGGIGFATFNTSYDQELAFAKADREFAFAVAAALATIRAQEG